MNFSVCTKRETQDQFFEDNVRCWQTMEIRGFAQSLFPNLERSSCGEAAEITLHRLLTAMYLSSSAP